jgi:hypothetical protein
MVQAPLFFMTDQLTYGILGQRKLTAENIALAARAYNLETAVIKAVVEVEAAGYGFLADGRIKILFEAHIFSQQTGGKFNGTAPTISSRTWNRKLYKGGSAELWCISDHGI